MALDCGGLFGSGGCAAGVKYRKYRRTCSISPRGRRGTERAVSWARGRVPACGDGALEGRCRTAIRVSGRGGGLCAFPFGRAVLSIGAVSTGYRHHGRALVLPRRREPSLGPRLRGETRTFGRTHRSLWMRRSLEWVHAKALRREEKAAGAGARPATILRALAPSREHPLLSSS